MKRKHPTYVAYCTVCHKYIFIAPKEEPVNLAADTHVEETGHTVIVGQEKYKVSPRQYGHNANSNED